MDVEMTPLPHSRVSIPAGADSGIVNMDVINSCSSKGLLPNNITLKPSVVVLVVPISVLALKSRSVPLIVHANLDPAMRQVKLGLGSLGQRTGLDL